MYYYWIIIISCLIVDSNCQFEIRSNDCTRYYTSELIEFICPDGSIIDKLDIDDIENVILDNIVKLKISGNGVRGPLTSIPVNICRLKNLTHLDLSYNRINNAIFDFTSPCLSKLEIFDLSNNFLSEIPVQWISQMNNLKSIYLSENKLYCIPNTMFYNISNIEILDVSSNMLTTFELWLIQIKNKINFSNNRITHFTNDFNVDLSNYQYNITQEIILNNTKTNIYFDDSLFEMYNRCKEINSTYTKILMKAITLIHNNNRGLLYWNCSCEQYYFQEYIISSIPGIVFSIWTCDHRQNISYYQKCNGQSLFSIMNTKPRLCKINDSEPGPVPVYVESDDCDLNFLTNTYDLNDISLEIYNKLITFNLSNEVMAYRFANIINRSASKLKPISSEIPTESIQNNFQNITFYIEQLLASINITLNISMNSVGILSLVKNSSIYSYSQVKQTDLSSYYSTEINHENLIASITIDEVSVKNLSETDIYTFYYLPSLIYKFAQKDQEKIIISPIVGVHLPGKSPRFINMSFTNIEYKLGKYSCEFWDLDHWNDTNCFHYLDSKSNHHYCFCNHTTSFALIFIPHKISSDSYIPSIIIAILSILCFCISIILSIRRQATSFRHLSIANIFTLLNSLILFILLTVIVIYGYHSSNKKLKIQDKCSISLQNLSIATYFFLISTFASKTFLGICYFLTIFFHFICIQFTSISNKWFYIAILLVILIAVIPIIIINIILHQWTNFFVLYENICWFNSSLIFRFISIPIIIFISLNLLIIFGITIRLIQFCIGHKIAQTNEKRMIIAIMIWLSLYITLGIAWIFGPFLDIIINEKNQSSSTIIQWIFGYFVGLEGVWVLIINMIFYFNQKKNIKNHRTLLYKLNKYQF